MDDLYRCLAGEGRWVEIALIVGMVVVALVSLKLMVSVAARVVVLVVTVALIGVGLICLHGVRKERRWVSFQIQYRARVTRSRGYPVPRKRRCTLKVEGRFRHFKYSEAKDKAAKQLAAQLKKTRNKKPPKKNPKKSPQKGRGGKRGGGAALKEVPLPPIQAKCQITLTCGDEFEKLFGPEGTCEYHHENGTVDYETDEGAPVVFYIQKRKAQLTQREASKKKRLTFRLSKIQVRRPVF